MYYFNAYYCISVTILKLHTLIVCSIFLTTLYDVIEEKVQSVRTINQIAIAISRIISSMYKQYTDI